jgi:hypothetical protein
MLPALSRRRAWMFLVALVLPSASLAQLGGPPKPDAQLILAAAKAASGGAAWDKLLSQHSKVTIHTGGFSGNAERWSDVSTGRSLIRFTVGPVSGASGFDGTVAWSQDETGKSQAETDATSRELAVNAAYRDRLGFWYPDRARAVIAYKERIEADGATFEVVRITPEGGRPFELWINTETKLIERLVEREDKTTRTETYMDLRPVQGVQIPFRVHASRGDPRFDETVVVEAMDFNAPLAGVSFAQPAPPKPDFAFPAGKAFVEVPVEIHSGHLFVRMRINGKGPFRMLFDTGSLSVLMPKFAAQLGLKDEGTQDGNPGGAKIGVVRADKVELGGLTLDRQTFATIDLADLMRRVEGLDDVAGIIGHELFKRFPTRLDFVQARATFYDPATYKHDGAGTAVPITFRGTAPKVAGTVDGIAGAFLIDTGSRGSLTLTSPFVHANGLAAKFDAKAEVIAGKGIGGLVRARLARAGELQFGGITIKQPVTTLARDGEGALGDPDLAGIIGFGILRQFNLTFDYARNVIHFAKNGAFGAADAYDRAGLWLERVDKGFEVVDVVAGGPAAAAGLKAGDVVVGVNGKAWSATTLSSVRNDLKAAPGTKVRLRLAAGGERIVTLRDLI